MVIERMVMSIATVKVQAYNLCMINRVSEKENSNLLVYQTVCTKL